MPKAPSCMSCAGTGEMPSERGPIDCPDCGGGGHLPARSVLVEWRSRDIDRRVGAGGTPTTEDARWLLAELRTARAALTEIISLAHDTHDDDGIGMRVRFVANRALGLYEVSPPPPSPAPSE